MKEANKLVIYFDGYCGLCNKFVDFLLRIDKQNKLLFSPLQGDYAKEHIKSKIADDIDSIVIEKQGVIYIRSKAVFEIIRVLGGGWKIFLVISLLPNRFNDMIYNWVARNRYTLFGKRSTCRLPTPLERTKFLS